LATYRSGFIGNIGSVVNQDHFFFGDFFLFGDHFSASLEIDSPFGLYLKARIVFYAAAIVTAPALSAGAGFSYGWPFEI
jgi:hypothetical protein